MRSIQTAIAMAAPPDRIWAMLTDFVSYPTWNPFITRIEGEARKGARLRVRIEPPGRRAMTFSPTVLTASPGRELRWLGRLLIPGLFDGEHVFLIDSQGGTSRFRQEERFSGVLVPLFSSVLEPTRRGFEAMNASLKARVEQ
jgi:hypothetical protein